MILLPDQYDADWPKRTDDRFDGEGGAAEGDTGEPKKTPRIPPSPFQRSKSQEIVYRGMVIEREEDVTNIGYAPSRHNRETHKFTNRTRKVSGYRVHYPDGGGTSTLFNTLKEAKQRIDSYLD